MAIKGSKKVLRVGCSEFDLQNVVLFPVGLMERKSGWRQKRKESAFYRIEEVEVTPCNSVTYMNQNGEVV